MQSLDAQPSKLVWTCKGRSLFQGDVWFVSVHNARHAGRRVGSAAVAGVIVASNLAVLEQQPCLWASKFFHIVLLDSLCGAVHADAFNFSRSVVAYLHWVGISMPHDIDKVHVPVLDISTVIDALKADLRAIGNFVVCCPRHAPISHVVQSASDQWNQPCSARRSYCQLLVLGRNMRRFLQFRFGCHWLPNAVGCRSDVAGACSLQALHIL